MPQNYAGRVTTIIVVLLIGLFGVPFLVDGIFSQKKFFDPKVPFREKLNLKPGIDIAGGTSLLYEIKQPEGQQTTGTGSLAEQVATLLKKRVDPNGVRNLVWRPQGDTRLEIQLPRSSVNQEGGGAKVKDEYRNLTREIAAYNVAPAQVVNAVENLKGDERAKALEKLAKGSEQRKNLFAILTSTYDRMKAAEAQYNELKKSGSKDQEKITKVVDELAQARIDYDAAKPKIEQTNLQVADLEAILAAPAEVRTTQLGEVKAKYPERATLIAKLEAIYPKYQTAKESIDDSASLKQLLKGSGVLSFHILAVPPGQGRGDASTISAEAYQAMVTRFQNEGPVYQAGDETRWFEVDKPEEFSRSWPTLVNPKNGKHYTLAWITPEKSMVHSERGQDWALKRAYPTPSQRGDLIVGFEFDPIGAERFANLTGANINKPLGTVLDNRIITAPTIRSQIGASGTIDGGDKGYTEAERNYLVSTLNAGSLPAQLEDEPISERQVGATLGLSNLRAGLLSCVIGLFVASIFLVVYYHLAGFVAVFGLIFNLVIILGVSAMMGATFTLPGIAALVLTIGMAVDANVLIYERLREEQLRGLSLKLAIRNAYDRAFTAILDSNVTTAITSGFLIYFGSEEVKGFGLTLLVGILASMFSALFVGKTIFGLMIERYNLRKLGSLPLSFPRWNQFLHPKVDWMGKAKYFLAFSVIFGVVGLTYFFIQSKNRKMFDVEFAAGTEVQFSTKREMNDNDVRERIERFKDEIPQPTVVAVGESGKEFSVVTANSDRQQVSKAIVQAMGQDLDVAVPSEFAKRDLATAEEAVKAGVVLPVKVDKAGRFLIDDREIPNAVQYGGGAAVVLRNITPPLTPEEIHSRISRAAQAANGGDVLQQFEVNPLDPAADPKAPTDAAVVLVPTKNLSYAKSPADWQEKLVAPLWKATVDGVGQPANLQKISNFEPQVASDTQRDAIFATLGSIVAIMVWIWLRFGDPKYGTATVMAMVHDTVLVIAAIGMAHLLSGNIVGRMLGVEAFRVNMTLVAAILTVMGYSMVDTIVVFDRIREIRGKYGVLSRQLINDAVNQTLSRTLLTAGTTLMTLLVMYIWGGPAIHGFTFILLIGIIIGTYSSIAVAAPFLLVGAKQPVAGQKPPKATGTTGAASPSGAVKVGA
jgi:SecD/SecF fusion protein